MKKAFALMFLAVFSVFAVLQTARADDALWRQSLKQFLTENFPSLTDQAALSKNNIAYWDNHAFNVSEFSSDTIIEGQRIYLTLRGTLNDLDGDGIPEALIRYGSIDSGAGWQDVYKFSGAAYEKIGTLSGGEYSETLYMDSKNRIISFTTDAFEVLEIKDNAIVRSEYIDAQGNRDYKGIPYSEIGSYTHMNFGFTLEEVLSGLRSVPQIKVSGLTLLDPAVYLFGANPETGVISYGSAAVLVLLICSLASFCFFMKARS